MKMEAFFIRQECFYTALRTAAQLYSDQINRGDPQPSAWEPGVITLASGAQMGKPLS